MERQPGRKALCPLLSVPAFSGCRSSCLYSVRTCALTGSDRPVRTELRKIPALIKARMVATEASRDLALIVWIRLLFSPASRRQVRLLSLAPSRSPLVLHRRLVISVRLRSVLLH